MNFNVNVYEMTFSCRASVTEAQVDYILLSVSLQMMSCMMFFGHN